MAKKGKKQRTPSRMPAAETPLRSKVKLLTDEQLLTQLSGFGIALDRTSLAPLCEHNLSAIQLAKRLIGTTPFNRRLSTAQFNLIEDCVAHLWQRWFPELPSFDSFEDRLLAGYDLLEAKDAPGACRVWLEAWAELLALLDRAGITSLAQFERHFGAQWVVLDWINALDNELWNVGLDDPQFLRTRIALCEDSLKRFAADEFFSETCRMALAESHFELNHVAHTDSLYRQWLSTDPQWGWGWISWAHCYQSARLEMKDLNRAEQILIEGQCVVQVRDADDITRNLAYIYQQQGRLQASRQLLASVQSTTVRPSGLPKVGRNDPCPCGSGKKFKKCCANHICAA